VKLATNTDFLDGTSRSTYADNAVTVGNLNDTNLQANESFAGVIKLATAAMGIAGTDTTTALTPDVHENIWSDPARCQLVAGGGYQKFPNGLILQWGLSNSNDVTGAYTDFPIPFPTACLCAVICDGGGSSHTQTMMSFTNIRFRAMTAAGASAGYYFAVGY